MPKPMTVEGERKLREELYELRGLRPEVSKAIGEARKDGDLSENADYHAAKERQGLMEARIRQIEAQLTDIRIIDVTKFPNTGTVIFGSTVTIEDLDSSKKSRYRIVGESESDPSSGTISNTSPLARAMIGKKLQDVFVVGEGENEREYCVSKVEHI